MKRVFVNSGLTLAVFFWAALGLGFAQDQQPSPASVNAPFAGATISQWKGTIHLNLPGQATSSPAQGETLPPGTVLETGGGQLLLQLVDGSQVLVRAHTRLTVQQPTATDRGYFQLLLGRIRASITKRTGGAPAFELGTPSAVIAVRGTQFDVEVNRQQETLVDVSEGTVEVISRYSGTSVLVQTGSSTRVGLNSPPETPRPTSEMHPNAGNNQGFQAGGRPDAAASRASQGAAHPRGKP